MDLRRRNKQHVMETVEGKAPPRTHGLLAIGARMSAFSGCSTTSVEGTSFRGASLTEGRDKTARRLMGHNPRNQCERRICQRRLPG